METGKITKFDLDRIIDAVEHEFNIVPKDKPKVEVTDLDSDSGIGHIVDVESLECDCSDFKYRCNRGQYCKHIYHTVFRKNGML